MKMLKHKVHGTLYTFHEFLAKAEDIETIEVPDEEAPTPDVPPIVPAPDAPKALDKMTHAELLALATSLAGDGGPITATMKKAELIAYIKGEDL